MLAYHNDLSYLEAMAGYMALFVILGTVGVPNRANPSYVGCYKDHSGDRTLNAYFKYMDPNGMDYCSVLCIQKGYRYAGTEYGHTCYCGNVISEEETNSNKCNYYPCRGNHQEKCGGRHWISIYDTWPNPTGYLGCYRDYKRSRTLAGTYKRMDTNGAIYCVAFCIQRHYRYAGTEHGSRCYCGNTMRRYTESSNCNNQCRNNEDEMCGGYDTLSIYDTWQCAKGPCQHDGVCTDLDKKRYECSCNKQWSGTHCEVELTTTTNPSSTTTTTTTTTTSTTTTTTTETTPTTLTTTTSELPPATILVDKTETTFDTTKANSTSLYEKQTDADDETVVTTYISVACVVVVMVVVVVIVLLISRRRTSKAGTTDTIVLHEVETTNNTVNDGTDNIAYINVDTSSRRTTLYDNEHVIMTADGERVDIEFNATQFTNDCDDYNILSLDGKSVVKGFNSKTIPDQRTNDVENIYSHLNEHNHELTLSDTYSRVTRNRQTKKSHLCDSTYSHVGQIATQSMAIENVMPPDGVYNSLNTLPKTTGRGKHVSNFKAISIVSGDEVYSNISTTEHAKGVGLDEDNYAHVLDYKLSLLGPQKDIYKTNHASNTEHTNVKDKRTNITQDSASTETDDTKTHYHISKNVDDNKHDDDNFYDDHNYYNVSWTNQKV